MSRLKKGFTVLYSISTLHHHHFHKSFVCHHLPISLIRTRWLLAIFQFPFASTLGLMYNNTQLTSISFNYFPLKILLSFKNIPLPQLTYLDRMQMKVTSHLVQIFLKNGPPCVLLVLSISTSSSSIHPF